MAAKGFDASRETAMSPQVGQYQILHLATHGFINSDHPEMSGIVLTMVNRDGTEAQGFLQLHDIYNLRLSADLTVLSACDTALGKDIKGEGLIGLTRGFMHAGSRSVVASLWKVDDRATSVLMGHFYKAMLQDGMPPAAALRFAKEKLRQEKSWRAPYFWAGFVLQGEYNQRINVDTDSAWWPYLFGSLAVTLILVSGLVFRSRGRIFKRRSHELGLPLGVQPDEGRIP
jgi:CHAT domain-containing protein